MAGAWSNNHRLHFAGPFIHGSALSIGIVQPHPTHPVSTSIHPISIAIFRHPQ